MENRYSMTAIQKNDNGMLNVERDGGLKRNEKHSAIGMITTFTVGPVCTSSGKSVDVSTLDELELAVGGLTHTLRNIGSDR